MKTESERRENPIVPESEPDILIGQKEVSITYCPETNYVRHQKRWTKKDLQTHILQQIKKSITYNQLFDTITCIHEDVQEGFVEITLKGMYDNRELTQTYQLPYSLRKETSPLYAKLQPTYLEGTIQLRDCTDEQEKIFRQKLRDMQEKEL